MENALPNRDVILQDWCLAMVVASVMVTGFAGVAGLAQGVGLAHLQIEIKVLYCVSRIQ